MSITQKKKHLRIFGNMQSRKGIQLHNTCSKLENKVEIKNTYSNLRLLEGNYKKLVFKNLNFFWFQTSLTKQTL